MPANSSGLFTGYLMGKFPGRVGWIIGPGGWREPRSFIPYCFDNGAFPVWSKGKVWNEAPFYELCNRVNGREHKPRWIAVPDVVASREGTLRSWEQHSPRVARYQVPLAFVVQDGMTPDDVPEDAQVVFVGGSTEWKWDNLKMWTENFQRVHVGRVNGERGLWLCHEAGAESCDGTGWFRGDQRQLAGLINYLEQTTNFHIGKTQNHKHMKQTTRITIANLLATAGAVLTALADEFVGTEVPDPTTPAAKPKKMSKAEKPAEKPADPAPAETAAESTEETKAKTYEELKAMIEPLVRGGQGADVKKVIAKYAMNLQELATKPEHHAAFETDLAALSY